MHEIKYLQDVTYRDDKGNIASGTLNQIHYPFSSTWGIDFDASVVNLNNTDLSECTTGSVTSLYTAPLYFDSFSDFEEALPKGKSLNYELANRAIEKLSFIEVSLPEFSLDSIAYREDIYISARYTSNEYDYDDQYSDYDNERLSTAIYQVYLFADGTTALERSFGDAETIEINEKPAYIVSLS